MRRMFVFEPVESMQENVKNSLALRGVTGTHNVTEESWPWERLRMRNSVCVAGVCGGSGGGQLSTESTRLQPPLSCYHSNLSSGHPTHTLPVTRTMTPPMGRVWRRLRDRRKKKRIGALGGAMKENLKSRFAHSQVWQRQGQSRVVRGHFFRVQIGRICPT